jgi:hypothetical protein
MKKLFLSSVALAAIVAGGPSNAADIPAAPIYKAPGAAVAQSGGFYLWADGSTQSIRLPTYDLGFRLQPPGQGTFAANTFDPRATGYGVSGGLGFVLPPGMALSNVGTNARIEFSGSYVNATASQAGSTTAPVFTLSGLPQLSGIAGAVGCGFGPPGCSVSGTLATGYSSWQASARFATDYKANGVTFTPSLAMFGGKSRSAQTLSQTLLFSNGNLEQYDANTTLAWTDWGGRAGLTGSVPVTDWLTFVAGGNAGLAARRVSLAGSDSQIANNGGFIFGFLPSSIAASQTTTTFVANAETSVIIRFAPSWSLRAFGGVNYDNKVPGVSAPGFVIVIPPGGGQVGIGGSPAGIKYQAETSYYAGGGLTAKF